MFKTNNLVLYCPFEGNPNDYSGNNYNGTLINSPTLVDGKFGKCYEFNGTNQTIRYPTSLGTFTSGLSMACWIYTDSFFTSEIFRKEDGNSRFLFSYQFGNILSFGINVGGYSELDVTIDENDYLNQWVHVCCTYNDTTKIRKIYRNAIQIGTDTLSGTFTYGGVAFGYIGSSNNTTEWFDGKIEQFTMFNKELTIPDIKRLMLGLHPIS